ncbi:MAG: LCP family protein [Cyanobacteria bacterium P01_F01_bin.153]
MPRQSRPPQNRSKRQTTKIVSARLKKPKPRFRPLRWLLITFGLISVATVSATTGALLALSMSNVSLSQRELSPEEASQFSGNGEEPVVEGGLQFPRLTRPVNILLLGIKVVTSDVDDELTEKYGYHALVNSFEGLSDTMLLLRFDPTSKRMSVLSIPRDTRTWVEGLGTTKINAANSYGGPALSARATSELLGGIPIDRYIRINVQGVEKLIDVLGGITVHVPQDMKYQDDSQHLYINLKQGRQHLNGEQALQFLRFRYDAYGDIGRVQRQQMAIRAVKEQALNPGTLLKLPQILSTIREHIDTNLSVEEIAALAGFSSQVGRDRVQMLMLPGEFGDTAQYGGVSYWLPYPRRISQVMAEHFDFGELDIEGRKSAFRSRIVIQDSTGDREAVQRLIAQLQVAGFRRVQRPREWSEPLTTSRIVAQNGDAIAAKAVQAAMGVGEVRVDSTGYLESDITIQLGRDWLEQQEAPALEGADDEPPADTVDF